MPFPVHRWSTDPCTAARVSSRTSVCVRGLPVLACDACECLETLGDDDEEREGANNGWEGD